MPEGSTVRRGRVSLKPGWQRDTAAAPGAGMSRALGAAAAVPAGATGRRCGAAAAPRPRPASGEPPGAGQERKAQNQRGPGRSSTCPAQVCPPSVRESFATASCWAGPGRSQGIPGAGDQGRSAPRLHIHPTALTPGRGWRGQRSKHKKAPSTPCAALPQPH